MQRLISTRTVGLLCALLPMRILHAQGFDPSLAGEVNLIRAEVVRSNLALRQYTWTEHTEVLVKGKVQSARDLTCRYDATGQIVKTPFSITGDKDKGSAASKRERDRRKADQQDYIDRAITLIGYYIPPDPQQLDAMLARGDASVEPSEPGKLQIRFKRYYKDGDSVIFAYDSASKALRRVTVLSDLGPKDPVAMDAVFESLPDGVNHLASTTVTAKTKKIEVKTRNLSYKQVN